MLLNYTPGRCLPSAEDLPDCDDTPVDNQLHVLVPQILQIILAQIWSERQDWYFGINMGIYYNPQQPTDVIVPDGFLSIGVPRIIDEDLRLSYVLWDEQVIPILILEVVSQTRRGEYTDKKAAYAKMGVLYYVIYNPLRKRKPRLEVYQLDQGEYQLLTGKPVWLSEISLGIGREIRSYQGIEREWLYWYDQKGQRYLTPEERVIEAERQVLEAQRRSKQLEEKLKSLGLDPKELS